MGDAVRGYMNENSMSIKSIRNVVLGIAGLIVALFIGVNSFESVPVGHAGVPVWLGRVGDEPHGSGKLQLVVPFTDLVPISLQAQSLTESISETDPNAATVRMVVNDGSGDSAVTLQTVGYTVNSSWRVANPGAAIVLMEQFNYRPGREEEFITNILAPVFRASIKQVFSNYELTQLAANQARVQSDIEATFQAMLNERLSGQASAAENAIVISSTVLSNYDWSQELENAFAATVNARQQRELAMQTLERARVEMETQVAQAEAERRSGVERATGLAEALRIQADSERYAREQAAAGEGAFFRNLRDSGVDPDTYILTQRWNGTVPYINSGSGGSTQTLIIPQMPQVGNLVGR